MTTREQAIGAAFTRRTPRAIAVEFHWVMDGEGRHMPGDPRELRVRYATTKDRDEAMRLARADGYALWVHDHVTVVWR